MPTFDPEIARIAERLLIKPRPIDYRVGVFASEVTPGKVDAHTMSAHLYLSIV